VRSGPCIDLPEAYLHVQFTDLGFESESCSGKKKDKGDTDVSEKPIEGLYVSVYNFERDELVVILCYLSDEQEGGITLVDDLVPSIGIQSARVPWLKSLGSLKSDSPFDL